MTLPIQKAGVYVQSAIETTALLYLSLADIDAFTRVVAGVVGVLLGLLTAVKILQRIRSNHVQYLRDRLDLKMKDEEVRRFFENKYNSKPQSNDSSRRGPEVRGPEGKNR